MNKITLKELTTEHPYYASQSNYYSNEPYAEFDSWEDFNIEFGSKDTDIDMNLCIRFDIKKELDEDGKETGLYYMELVIIHQRKGIYAPKHVREITEKDVPSILKYLRKHYKTIQANWAPISI